MNVKDQLWLELIKLVKFAVITMLIYWLFHEPIEAAFNNTSSFQLFGVEFHAVEKEQRSKEQDQLMEMEAEVNQEIQLLQEQLLQLKGTKQRIQEKLDENSAQQPADSNKKPLWLSTKPQRLK